MNVLKGIYHDGIVELLENPQLHSKTEVLIIFPEKQKMDQSLIITAINGINLEIF
jgi:hypothetical protein